MSEKVKKFRLFDAVLVAVCVVLVVESSAPAAAIGNSQFFWWIFLLLGFFLPYGLISAELGTAYEDEGGIYDWVRRAFGNRWGSRVAWYYYINFPLWMGSLAVLFTDVIMQMFGIGISPWIAVPIQLLFIWGVVLVSSFKISESKWLLNTAAVFKALLMLAIGGLGIYTAIRYGSKNDFSWQSFIPSLDLTGLSYVSVIIFNFLGFEVVTTFASEMKKPERDIPRALILGGIIIAFFYILSSFGISVAIPKEELSVSGGIIESFMSLTNSSGGWFIILVGFMFLFTLVANLASWSMGVNYVAKYAAENRAMPKIFAKEDSRGMPMGANVTNGMIASVIVLVAPFIPSQDIFWSFFALNMVTLLMSYILMFPTFLKLRKVDGGRYRPFRVKGGPIWLFIMTYLPMALLIISVLVSVLPLSLDAEELNSKLPIVVGTLIAVVIGELIAAGADRQKILLNKEIRNENHKIDTEA